MVAHLGQDLVGRLISKGNHRFGGNSERVDERLRQNKTIFHPLMINGRFSEMLFSTKVVCFAQTS